MPKNCLLGILNIGTHSCSTGLGEVYVLSGLAQNMLSCQALAFIPRP